MNQETNSIWANLYAKYLGKEISGLPAKAINLFYFIDMTYYVLNGGASGFLYNKSPTNSNENLYKPYIKSLEYFNYRATAQLLNEYNNRFHKALNRYKLSKNEPFDLYFNQELPTEFCTILNSQIEEIVANEESIHKWIKKNRKELNQILE